MRYNSSKNFIPKPQNGKNHPTEQPETRRTTTYFNTNHTPNTNSKDHNIPNTSVTIDLTPQTQYTQTYNHNIPKQSGVKEGALASRTTKAKNKEDPPHPLDSTKVCGGYLSEREIYF